MLSFLQACVPRANPITVQERVRSAAGALIGIFVTGAVCRLAVGTGTALPVLIAPMGASAVLLFAVPASPLAQPWSVVGGNLLAAVVGVGAARFIPDATIAASAAIAAAIALMMVLRCLHPPSGAVALTAVLGGRAIGDLGFGFVLWPVGANSILIVAVALLFNNLVGRSYPHRPAFAPEASGAGASRPRAVGFDATDLDEALAEYGQLLDIDRGDLEAVLRDAELRSYRRKSFSVTCGAIMSRGVVAVAPDAPFREALRLMRERGVTALPVTDERAHVLGLVTQTDLLDKAAWTSRGPRQTVGHRLRVTLSRGRASSGSVEEIMSAPARTVVAGTSLADAVYLMASARLTQLPVVDGVGKLAGIVSQSDLMVALLAQRNETRR